MAKNHKDKTAKKGDDNKKLNQDSPAQNEVVFSDESRQSDEELFAQIKTALSEESYRKNEETAKQEPDDDGADGKVFEASKNKRCKGACQNKKDGIKSEDNSALTGTEETFAQNEDSSETIENGMATDDENFENGLDNNPRQEDDNASIEVDGKVKGKKKKKDKKAYEKTTFAHKMRVLGILLVLGIFTGSGLGVWYFNVTLKSNVDYGSMNVSDYAGDVGEVMERNFGITADSDRSSWLNVAIAQGKKPSDLSPVDNLLLAEYNATLADSYIALGVGRVDTIASQTVYSCKRFDGSRYTFESISKGILSVATCDTFVKGKSSVDVYNGNNIRSDGADWVYDSTITKDEYIELCGNMPSAIQPYLISEKTVLSSTEIVYDEENGNYTYTLELDPSTSVLLYYRQVKRSGALEADPEFYSIKYTITIDEEWNLVTLDVVENYKAVKFSMGNNCTGRLTTNFTFNVDVTLPV